jgi:hypothetical protein
MISKKIRGYHVKFGEVEFNLGTTLGTVWEGWNIATHIYEEEE